MKPSDPVRFFGSVRAVADICDVTAAAVYKWLRQGAIPYDKQCLIQLEAAKVKGKRGYPVASKKDAPERQIQAAA
jgi:hypothetical protein